ncbi:2-oxoacid:acceptor oxidoreductase subunit alpha [Candidatus Woesebacteria bacterium]|nr:2-oxoacid:acceptor oxidoreductase subunit alpha [Candidatus Woesebacteria bacterium]
MQKNATYIWKIGAPAGFGVMTIGLSISKLAARSGYHIFDYSEYPSLIRGGHNTYEVAISGQPVHSTKQPVDFLICFDQQTSTLHESRLHAESVLMYDPGVFDPITVAQKVPVPFQGLLNELKADKIMVNMIGLGASFALMGGKEELLIELINDQFARKGREIVEANNTCARTGYNYITQHHPHVIKSILAFRPDQPAQVVLAGNDAFSLGAVAADCRFYAAYPMSPSSSVLETLAAWQRTTGMVVRHAEDEIGVANEALGASFAGVRSATGSSGGGFALMAETLSYAGIAELPLVVFVAQRPGPATGMPTWTEQGDLLFSVFAGHGEFPKIVLAPGDPAEMIDQTMKAFDLADIYQTPVIVLSDKMLSESHLNVPEEDMAALMNRPINRGKTIPITTPTQHPYERYALSEDGISPRLIPGSGSAWYQANSYEHLADSHTTEDMAERVAQVKKRSQKIETYLKQDFAAPTVYGDIEEADSILFSWGGNKGAILDAVQELRSTGKNVCFLHFTHLYPLSPKILSPYFSHHKPYIQIENNGTGQFGQLLKMAIGFETPHKLLKCDGRPIFREEVVATVQGI